MEASSLIKMANQIGTFFESMPNHQQALEDIATHLKRFWAPKMRKIIVDCIDQKQDAEMMDIVREAINTHRDRLV
jgi:formate dehydrogenase subunit delta